MRGPAPPGGAQQQPADVLMQPVELEVPQPAVPAQQPADQKQECSFFEDRREEMVRDSTMFP